MKRTIVLAAVVTVLAAPVAVAQDLPISAGVRASTLGAGAELALGLTDRVEARGIGNFFSLSRDMDISEITYGIDLKLRSAGALLDLYLAGPLRLTAGGMWNGNELSGSAAPTAPLQIGDTTYSGADVAKLTLGVDFKKFAPFAGLGFSGRGRVSFFFDLGVVFAGSPEVDYWATTTTLTGAAKTVLDQQVNTEASSIEDDLKFFKYYPVVGLGLRFRLE